MAERNDGEGERVSWSQETGVAPVHHYHPGSFTEEFKVWAQCLLSTSSAHGQEAGDSSADHSY